MNLHSTFCYCYITWTCSCIIHLSEGALLLYYMYILYFTPTWRYLAIVLWYCIGLYTYLRGPCFYIILYSIVQDTYLRGPCYCSTLYYTPTWGGPCFYTILYYIVQDTYLRGPCYCPGDWRRRQALPFSPAVQTVLLHPLSKYENKIKYTSYM